MPELHNKRTAINRLAQHAGCACSGRSAHCKARSVVMTAACRASMKVVKSCSQRPACTHRLHQPIRCSKAPRSRALDAGAKNEHAGNRSSAPRGDQYSRLTLQHYFSLRERKYIKTNRKTLRQNPQSRAYANPAPPNVKSGLAAADLARARAAGMGRRAPAVAGLGRHRAA